MPTLTRPAPAVKPARKPRAVRPAHGTCRLTLTINGTLYGVRPLPIDPSIGTKAFRLRKSDGTLYDVALTPRGPRCDCPDFTFSRDGVDQSGCKHIKSMVACGLL